MNTRTDTAGPARISAWDRAAILALGGAGCALSYDALQQMAEAIHVRGLLTYLFPLVIDGFIAYGVRALVVLRTAPFWSRLYVWALFGTATAASIWANALHAVRLNQQHQPGVGLRLGDGTVGLLSTLAPLALAGAVHLYILIARRTAEAPTSQEHTGQHSALLGHPSDPVTGDQPEATGSVRESAAGQVTRGRSPAALPGTNRTGDYPAPALTGADQPRRNTQADQPTPSVANPAPRLIAAPGQISPQPAEQGRHRQDRAGQKPAPAPFGAQTGDPEMASPEHAHDTDELLSLARRAVTEADKVTRAVVAEAIRGQGIPLSNARLTALMKQLRERPTPGTEDEAA